MKVLNQWGTVLGEPKCMRIQRVRDKETQEITGYKIIGFIDDKQTYTVGLFKTEDEAKKLLLHYSELR